MNRAISRQLTVVVCCLLGMFYATTASAQGVYDGTWEGQTSDGRSISFTVQDDVITELDWSSVYTCLITGSSSTWGHRRSPNTTIVFDQFVYQQGFSGGAIEDGSTFPTVIGGFFSSPSDVSGQMFGLVAAFQGIGGATQPCTHVVDWTGQRISLTSLSSDAGPDYDTRQP